MQNPMPELMSSMPLNTATNTSIGMSEFNNFDPKNPLKSLPRDLVPMPFKSMNMGGGMFSSSSGTLFGGPRSISSSSSSLQLSSNSSSGFNYLQDSKNGCPIAGTAHMSATALLQKAAQIGATASNSINSPMMQKSFTSGMAGPDQQLSSIKPPSYAAIQQQQQHNASYDHFASQPEHSNMAGINGTGGFTNQIMQKTSQEISHLFDGGTDSAAMNDMGMFSSMYMSGDHQNPGFMKSMENEDSSGSSSFLQAGRNTMERNTTGPSRFGGNSAGADMLTLDFMGIGGTRPTNLQDQQQHNQIQQQRLELEAMGQQHQRMQIMNPLQQQLSHGDSAIEKPIWDV